MELNKYFIFIIVLILFSCTQRGFVTWEYEKKATFGLYLRETNKVSYGDTIDFLKNHHIGKLNVKRYEFKMNKDKNYVVAGVQLFDSLGQPQGWSFVDMNK